MSETAPESDIPEAIDPDLDPDGDELLTEESAATDGTNDEPENELDPVAKLSAEVEKWRNIAARNQADLENFRKRMAREKADAIHFANGNLLQSLLPVIDNFEMGLKAAADEGEESMIYQGMVMVQKQLNDFLEENGVEILSHEDRTFDPNQHEAVKQEPSDTIPEGDIIYELRRGQGLNRPRPYTCRRAV